jgi:Sialic acid synthase
MDSFFKNIKNRKTPYMIAEIGINHNGDINLSKKLIDGANACEWDCVKFQKRDPDVCVPEDQKNIMRDTPWGKMAYIEYKHKIEFNKKEYDVINEYCRQKPIDWSVSVWDLNSLKFIKQYEVPFIKIPSAQFTNLKLIKSISKLDQSLVLSTGMTDWSMVDETVNILTRNNSRFALLHCNSNYPALSHE